MTWNPVKCMVWIWIFALTIYFTNLFLLGHIRGKCRHREWLRQICLFELWHLWPFLFFFQASYFYKIIKMWLLCICRQLRGTVYTPKRINIGLHRVHVTLKTHSSANQSLSITKKYKTKMLMIQLLQFVVLSLSLSAHYGNFFVKFLIAPADFSHQQTLLIQVRVAE